MRHPKPRALPFGRDRETAARTDTNAEITSDTAVRTTRVQYELWKTWRVHGQKPGRARLCDVHIACRPSKERRPDRTKPIRQSSRNSEEISARPLYDDDLRRHADRIEKRRDSSEYCALPGVSRDRELDESACFGRRRYAHEHRAQNAMPG